MELRVLALYPEQMNIYADRGNILFLRRRCEWRGIGFEYRAAGSGEAVDPAAVPLLDDGRSHRVVVTMGDPDANRAEHSMVAKGTHRGLDLADQPLSSR